MAATVTFHYLGPPEQKHVAKIGPMGTLRTALAEAAPKWRPPVDPATAQVVCNKKPVDLDTPFRLLNLPAGSRLDVVRGAAAPSPAAAPRAAAAAAAPAAAPAAASAAPPAAAAGAAAAAPSGSAQPAAPSPQQQPQASTSAAPQAAAGGGAAAVAGAAAAAAPAAASPQLAALGISIPISVFNQRAVEAAALARGPSPAASADPPDEFFEFTADDFAEAARAQQRRAAAESVLLTRALREQQAAARAAAVGPVPVRLHFPDGAIVQAEFAATQPASAVAALARAVAPPGLAPALYLYTTPPKVVLKPKDMEASLYDLKLVPAAHIHVGADAGKLPAGTVAPPSAASGGNGGWQWLRPEVAALMSDEVPDPLAGRAAAAAGSDGDVAARAGEEARARERAVAEARRLAAAAAGAGAGAGAAEDGGKKLPKWLKR